jgi:hypothetical protein
MARLDSGDASFVIQRLGENPFTIEGRIVGVTPLVNFIIILQAAFALVD